MKILASDYDGTISINETVSNCALEAIHEWRSRGHLFGLATGRDIRMTMKAINENQIPYDFLVCNNGCVGYDRTGRELFSDYIPMDYIYELIDSPWIARSRYIVLADQHGRYVYDNNFSPDGYHDQFYTDVLTDGDLHAGRQFYQMDTRYVSPEEMAFISERLQEDFGGRLFINPNIDTIDLTPLGVNKKTGLIKLCRHLELPENNIITIGDGQNDFDMIGHFRGYTLPWGQKRLREKAVGIVGGIEELIEAELS